MERAIIVLLALVLSAAIGSRRWAGVFARYASVPAAFVRDMERRLNREHRTPQERMQRGVLLLILFASVSALAGMIAGLLFDHHLIAVLVLAACLPLRSLWERLREVRKGLVSDNLALARYGLEGTIFRHSAILDAHGCARAVIELAAVQFSEKIVAGVFWYMLLGFPGLFVSKAVYLMRETIPAGEFGQAAARAHYALHYIPARLAAMLWLGASLFFSGVNMRQQVQNLSPIFVRAEPHRLALFTSASLLGISLGGPGSPYVDGWIGAGRTRVNAADVKRVEFLYGLLGLLLFVGLGFLI